MLALNIANENQAAAASMEIYMYAYGFTLDFLVAAITVDITKSANKLDIIFIVIIFSGFINCINYDSNVWSCKLIFWYSVWIGRFNV